jgi:trans-2,3-dihydro-3-hydroxyanthranilate isomerase
MDFQHVDVFAGEPFTGNSLTVFIGDGTMGAGQLLAITQEFRHFESVFLTADGAPDHWRARVFDLSGELDFAGHPLLGAAAVLHERLGSTQARTWSIQLPTRTVAVQTVPSGSTYRATMDQGRPDFGRTVTGADLAPVLAGIGLQAADLVAGLDPAVVSTGLRYLVIPVCAVALARAGITVSDFGDRLAAAGAQYAYLLDPEHLEGRHWNNDGQTEDVATGSAAGVVGAYLARSGRVPLNTSFDLRQGRFAGRPSRLRVTPEGTAGHVVRVMVSGDVALVAKGTLAGLPGAAPTGAVSPGAAPTGAVSLGAGR